MQQLALATKAVLDFGAAQKTSLNEINSKRLHGKRVFIWYLWF
jgi:hypothetical protein